MRPTRTLLTMTSLCAILCGTAHAQNQSITPTGDNTSITQSQTNSQTDTTTSTSITQSSTVNGTQINNTNTYIVPPDGNNTSASNGTNRNSAIRRRGSDSNWRRDASRPYNRSRYDRDRDDARYDRDDMDRRAYDRTNVERTDGISTPSNLYRDPSVTGSARTINNRAAGDGTVTPRTTGPAAPVYIMMPSGSGVYDSTAPTTPTTVSPPIDNGRRSYRPRGR